MAKSANDRHWHVAVPLFVGALALALMPIFMSHVAWAAFACLTVAAFGIWSPQGPLLSWPAVILSGTNAASGEHQWQRALALMMVCLFCLRIAARGIWSPHGPLLSWPAVIVSWTDAASGETQSANSSRNNLQSMVDSILWQALMHRCKCLRKSPAAGFALMKMMGSAGSFVGPYFIGVTSDASGSFTPAMLLLALCLLCAGVMQLFFREPGKKPSFKSLCSPLLVDSLFKPANHPLASPVLIS